jgi:hypothetical protein
MGLDETCRDGGGASRDMSEVRCERAGGMNESESWSCADTVEWRKSRWWVGGKEARTFCART